jgi:hypothetical protein
LAVKKRAKKPKKSYRRASVVPEAVQRQGAEVNGVDSDNRHDRRLSEGFPARIGAWSGERSKRANAIEPRMYGADPISDLLDWLNQNERTPSGGRVMALVSALQQYEHQMDEWEKACERLKLSDEARNDHPVVLRSEKEAWARLPADIRGALAAASLACDEAHHLLRRYSMYPRLTALQSRRGWWLMDFYMAYLPDEAPPLERDDIQKIYKAGAVIRPDSTLPRAVSEGDVVLILCGITSRGDIQRIRRCEAEVCNKFFYAEPRHKRRCSKTCTEWRTDNDPQFKKSRAEYMRKYRKVKKTVRST